MNSLSTASLETLTERARPFYSNELPYHNWEHAHDVMRAAGRIALTTTHPEVSRHAHLLVIAAAWHDAGYYENSAGAFATKEHYSAWLAQRNLRELSKIDRRRVGSAIVDTIVTKTEKYSTLGEALHMADLGYFAAQPYVFRDRLERLQQEWGNPSWETVVDRTRTFGAQALTEIEATAFKILPAHHAKDWAGAVQRNLDSLE